MTRFAILVGFAWPILCLLPLSPSSEEALPDRALIDVSADLLALGLFERDLDGNGQTDDTEAFQRAIDYAAAADGGCVYVPAGTYSIRSITMKDGVSLIAVPGRRRRSSAPWTHPGPWSSSPAAA
ncbi:MAG TPA: glycosyl hydrolase family 28-related protein [Candidatus Hydrogenedentes bacterium]|nr:glycosyl hydrolase family 28-related protein [Candidatus Hydrogenedentota bacterium]HPG65400.1 glycosyl hydrolase family 28-related protein [Candidatus Hydrogenedentota bacterium]